MTRNYFHQLTIAVDQLANALLAGHADETLSSRAYRSQYYKKRWAVARRVIDAIFFWQDDHCLNAYLSERERRHLPRHFLSPAEETQ